MKYFLLLTLVLCVACDGSRNPVQEMNEDSIVLHDSAMPDSMPYEPERKQDTARTIIFKATGNEPFWAMEIDRKDSVWLHFIDDALFTGIIPDSTDLQAEAFGFTLSEGSGAAVVTIKHEECTNSMSGFKSPYTVVVNVKKSSGQNKETYRGCGKFL